MTELHHGLSETPVMANQVVDRLSWIFNTAEDRGLVPEGSNPCRFTVKYRERKRERFLTGEEFRRLGRVLADAETCKGVSAYAVAAIRLLMLTGCRRNEILTLRWDEVDLEANELRLSDSKTGTRTISLSPEAARVLADLSRVKHCGRRRKASSAVPGRNRRTWSRSRYRRFPGRRRSRRIWGFEASDVGEPEKRPAAQNVHPCPGRLSCHIDADAVAPVKSPSGTERTSGSRAKSTAESIRDDRRSRTAAARR